MSVPNELRARWTTAEGVDVAEIRARIARVYPAPWHYAVLHRAVATRNEFFVATPFDAAHGEFIAHARTDIPQLCDEVERLRAIAEKYEADGNELRVESNNRLNEMSKRLAAAERVVEAARRHADVCEPDCDCELCTTMCAMHDAIAAYDAIAGRDAAKKEGA